MLDRALASSCLIAFALVTGCSGGSSGGSDSSSPSGATASFQCTARPAPAAPVAGASIQARAEATGLAMLDALVGRYVRGEVSVYRGTVSAHDNASALANTEVYGARPDGAISDGPALAMLDVRATSAGDWYPAQPSVKPGMGAVLVVHGVADGKHIVLEQTDGQPSTTWASGVAADDTNSYLHTSCSACAPDLASRPQGISFDGLTASGVVTVFQGYAGKGGKDVQVTATTVASAKLSSVQGCSLEFKDLAVLQTLLGPNEFAEPKTSGFQDAGIEMVWHTTGSLEDGSVGAGGCPNFTAYTIDLWINKTNLSDYGVRNFVAGASTPMCPSLPPGAHP